MIAVPAAQVPASVRALAQRGGRAAVIFSSGFAEMGEAGRALELEITATARAAGLRLCGPNCLGLINAFDQVIATFGQFAEGPTPPGPVAFVTQSGAFGTAIAALARRRALGLGYFVNTGNECDVDFVQTMRAVLDDERIRVGAGYLEGVRFFLSEKERSSQYFADLLRTKDRDMIDLAYKNHPQHQMGRKPYPDMNAVKATMDIMASREPQMQNLKADELFNLSYLKQLDQSGFIDQLYRSK